MGKNISKKNLEKLKKYLSAVKSESNFSEVKKSSGEPSNDKHGSVRGTTRVQR